MYILENKGNYLTQTYDINHYTISKIKRSWSHRDDTKMFDIQGLQIDLGLSWSGLKQNRSTEGCSKLKTSVDMTCSGKNGLNIRTNASPKWDRTRCPDE